MKKIMRLKGLQRFTATLVGCLLLAVGASAQNQPITLEMNSASLSKILTELQRQSGVPFVYNKGEVSTVAEQSIKVTAKPLDEVLKIVLADTGYTYQFDDGHVIIVRAKAKPATKKSEPRTLSGKVCDENGKPMTGVTVSVKETGRGTITTAEGRYLLREITEGQTIVYSYMGYTTHQFTLQNQTTCDVDLKPSSVNVEDVVVVGYATQKRVDLTGAVSTVNVDKAINSRPVNDIGRALQGQTPGLLVTTSSGNIGTDAKINLRGMYGSVNSNATPLILLDNVEIGSLMMINPNDIESISVLKDAAASSIYGTRAAWGVILITSKQGAKGQARVSYENNFAWSSPVNTPVIADGADGAEFMLECLRRTAPNTASFNILGAYYDDQSIDRMRQWKELYGGQNLGDEMVLGRDYEIRGSKPYFYRAWDVDDIFLNKATPQMKHNLSVSGSTDKLSYYASVGILEQSGLVKITPQSDKYSRYNATVKVTNKVNKWLTLRAGSMLTYSKHRYPNFRLSNASNGANEYWFNIYRYPETYPYGTINGVPLKNIRTELEQAHMNNQNSQMNRFTLGTTITLMKGWTVDGDYTFTANNNHSKVATSPISGINHWADATLSKYEANFFPAEDYVIVNSSWNQRHVGKANTTYSKSFGSHNIKLMAGIDTEMYMSEYQWSKRYGLLDASKPELILTDSSVQETTGYPTHWTTFGVFGRINYNYKSKYLFEVNLREDASSRFNKGHKWAAFPSMSAGWVVTSEPFMKGVMNATKMSFLKLRGSWGQLGNNNLGSYSYLSNIGVGKSNWFIGTANQLQASAPSVAATDLSWEKIENYDLGINMKFFDNALDIEFDYYQRITRDMATTGIEVPSSLGTSAPARNYGEMKTNGWELSISYNKDLNEDWNINASVQLSDYTSKITKFANKEVSIQTGGNGLANYEGKTMGEIWGYESNRLFTESDFDGNNGAANPTWYYGENTPNQDVLNTSSSFHYGPGDVKYEDVNNDGVIDYGAGTNLDSGDMKVIGNTTPRYIYGFHFGFNYKNFDFAAFFQGVGKRDYWATGSLFIPGYTKSEAVYQNQMDYWTPERTDAYYPAPSNPGSNNHNGNYQCSTRYLLDMSYCRLKNLTMGYTLPSLWVKAIGLSSVRLFASGENLFTIDNLNITIDPEIQQNSVEGFTDAKSFGRTYPYFRTLSFGAQVNF